MVLPKKVLLTLLPFFLTATSQSTGQTTRYWDCCKASCGWTGKISLASGATPVKSCDRNDNKLTDFNAKSSCDNGGPAYMCTDASPWAVSETLSYGYAATKLQGGTESSWCCSCYELTFTSGAVKGKKMVVQSTNTGGDLGNNHFDLAIPGGGVGIFNGCTAEFGAPSTGWGAQYGGISKRSECDNFPAKLKPGCYWRFDWFGNSDNPGVTFQKVTCPAALTSRSGCVRNGETPTGPAVVPTWTPGAGTSSTSTSGTVSPTTAPGSGNSEVVAKYGQCGGDGWLGSTNCEAGTTCTASSPFYSQCL